MIAQSGPEIIDLERRGTEITHLVQIAHFDAMMVTHHLPPFHRRATRLMRTHDQSTNATGLESEINMQ